MPLAHFTTHNSHNCVAAICEICHKGGNHYGYGDYRLIDSKGVFIGEVHDFCSQHAKEYEKIWLKKERKKKLQKICR